jgi:hypothetical protein
MATARRPGALVVWIVQQRPDLEADANSNDEGTIKGFRAEIRVTPPATGLTTPSGNGEDVPSRVVDIPASGEGSESDGNGEESLLFSVLGSDLEKAVRSADSAAFLVIGSPEFDALGWEAAIDRFNTTLSTGSDETNQKTTGAVLVRASEVGRLGATGEMASQIGRHDEAENRFREMFLLTGLLFGELHEDTLACAFNVAVAVLKQERRDEAATLFGALAERQAEVLGRDHADTKKSIELQMQALGQEVPKQDSTGGFAPRTLFVAAVLGMAMAVAVAVVSRSQGWRDALDR